LHSGEDPLGYKVSRSSMKV